MRMGLYCYISYLLLFICIQIQLSVTAGEVVDVETGSLDTSYTYTADTDSQQLAYRCVSSGSADGLVWRYNKQEYTNPLSAYLFYAAVGTVGTFSIACYSVTEVQGAILLTIKDSASLVVEYSGVTQVYPLSSGRTQTATIPLDTSGIKITCKISRGSMDTPEGQVAATTDPSVTFSLTNTSGQGEYSCYRNIFDRRVSVLSLRVQVPMSNPVGDFPKWGTLAIVLVLMLAILLVFVVVVIVLSTVYLYRRHRSADRGGSMSKHSAVKMTPLKEITS